MKRSSTIKNLICSVAGVLAMAGTANAQLTENFDNITTLTGAGWSMQNNSTPIGTQANWFQGNATVYNAFNGATTSYIAANYNFVAGANTINGWLITPNLMLRNGDVITFYTRKVSPDTWPDRLEVRMSTNGASTNTGGGPTTVGDFTTLLLSINPTLVTGVYPIAWTQYTITISGLAAPTSGRIAFRYFVTNGGPSGANSDYIGIDAFQHTPYVCPTLTVTPGTLPGGTAGVAYNQTLGQTGALGAPSFALTAGGLPSGLTLSLAGVISGTPTATGTFNFTVTVSDASGCSGSQPYSITIVCPTNGASFASVPALCDNGPMYTLIEGSPAGGMYSGIGVSGGMFDPAVGTQTVTYTLTDVYGCTQTATTTITVNTAPAVTLSSFTAVCDNAGSQTLSGGSPAGGTYSGTNVSAGMFDPSAGSQVIDYTYVDANGCSNMASTTFPVNTSPSVTFSALPAVCDNAGMVTLTGGSPAGGTYSGTNVSGGMFDPSGGPQTITYTYTDSNSCLNSATQSQAVNAAPTVTLSAFTPVCELSGMVTLSGGSPAGGSYSGTNVSGGMFDPSGGSQMITYTYTDSIGCSNADSASHQVYTAPTVTVSLSPICDDNGMLTLSGGSPAGGTYSGVGVSAGIFDPSSGSQMITYIYTDSSGCSNMDSAMQVVNATPAVSASASSMTPCVDDANVTLTGSPAGGMFFGSSVTGNQFDPSIGAGAQSIIYTYTDSNSCSASDTITINVNACVGIVEVIQNNNISVYPNPASDNVTVLISNFSGSAVIRVMSTDGKVVMQQTTNTALTTLEVDHLAKGAYLLEVADVNGKSISKLLIQ